MEASAVRSTHLIPSKGSKKTDVTSLAYSTSANRDLRTYRQTLRSHRKPGMGQHGPDAH